MNSLKTLLSSAGHLFYPQLCTGCGSDLIQKGDFLCFICIDELPHTGFASILGNPIEKIFAGRLKINAAHSEFYFSKGQIIQHLIHLLKYNQNKEAGIYLGELTGISILNSGKFAGIDYLIPLPLYPDKEYKRGYNQAEIICSGIEKTTGIPVLKNAVIRERFTETQTHKHRAERWLNVDGSFAVRTPELLQGKNLLLVDDVITTGASLEACGQAINALPGTGLSIALLAHASK